MKKKERRTNMDWKISRKDLLALVPGDIVRIFPLGEDEGEYRCYHMPWKPAKFVLISIGGQHDFGGAVSFDVRLWKRVPPNRDRNRMLCLSYLDRDDCQNLSFNGESTCETHEYGIELVKKSSEQEWGLALQASTNILQAAKEWLVVDQPLDWYRDPTRVALYDSGLKRLNHAIATVEKFVKDLATGRKYPIFLS
jgi:hypothetical protein